ncbi:phytoene desaturase family protein [candidate division CSSED10-310 bacterium]|uniref:Phytoene desaturase family protein n=1 Tax=candidate division CSSED10-310 bacterium TaxID=2855610 RepID=A0ABV6YZW5_UNCC1
MNRRKIVIIGSGPGGLTAGMLLASKGYKIEVFEKKDYLGGRNSAITADGYTFDLGPTFLMMKYILDEMFELTGRNIEDYLDIKSIDPLYRLSFTDGREFYPSIDRKATAEQIKELFPGNEQGYERFFAYEEKKFKRLVPCLQIPYASPRDFLATRLIKALPYLDAHRNLYDHLSKYFDDHHLRTAFTFQAKYLGMSPWHCPATYSIIPYLEYGLGIYHPIGGLNQITKAMATVVEEEGGTIHLGAGVKQVLIRNGRAVGVLLENGEKVDAHDVILNADFAYAMQHLVPEKERPHYTDALLERKKYSCSTFMLYLGLDKQYDIPHHNIIFAQDYKHNVDEITETLTLSEDPSFYIQNATVTDPGLAPEGHSTIYILVPVANNFSDIDWEKEAPAFRDKIIDRLETRCGLTQLQQHIRYEKIITPLDWEQDKYVYKGATFNLAHNVRQMLHWRPHNKFEDIDNCFLVGGGTHPGSGLPTIFESGRISSGIILKRDCW